MKTFIKLSLIIFFISSVSKAEIVSKIIIEGNKRVSDETIKIYGDVDLNKDYSDLDLDRILKNLYETEFFEDVNLELKNNTLRINLKEYPIINQLIIIGEKAVDIKNKLKRS